MPTFTLWLFGRERLGLTIDLDPPPVETVTRSIGFAAAELAAD